MSPEYVRPYVKAQKNDDRDAEAIAEAATRPTMRFIELKSAEQLDMQSLTPGARPTGQRTNRIAKPTPRHPTGTRRSLPQGRRKLEDHLRTLLEGQEAILSPRVWSFAPDRSAATEPRHEPPGSGLPQPTAPVHGAAPDQAGVADQEH
jgi:transposase